MYFVKDTFREAAPCIQRNAYHATKVKKKQTNKDNNNNNKGNPLPAYTLHQTEKQKQTPGSGMHHFQLHEDAASTPLLMKL